MSPWDYFFCLKAQSCISDATLLPYVSFMLMIHSGKQIPLLGQEEDKKYTSLLNTCSFNLGTGNSGGKNSQCFLHFLYKYFLILWFTVSFIKLFQGSPTLFKCAPQTQSNHSCDFSFVLESDNGIWGEENEPKIKAWREKALAVLRSKATLKPALLHSFAFQEQAFTRPYMETPTNSGLTAGYAQVFLNVAFMAWDMLAGFSYEKGINWSMSLLQPT